MASIEARLETLEAMMLLVERHPEIIYTSVLTVSALLTGMNRGIGLDLFHKLYEDDYQLFQYDGIWGLVKIAAGNPKNLDVVKTRAMAVIEASNNIQFGIVRQTLNIPSMLIISDSLLLRFSENGVNGSSWILGKELGVNWGLPCDQFPGYRAVRVHHESTSKEILKALWDIVETL
jgi:hypothetical protein